MCLTKFTHQNMTKDYPNDDAAGRKYGFCLCSSQSMCVFASFFVRSLLFFNSFLTLGRSFAFRRKTHVSATTGFGFNWNFLLCSFCNRFLLFSCFSLLFSLSFAYDAHHNFFLFFFFFFSKHCTWKSYDDDGLPLFLNKKLKNERKEEKKWTKISSNTQLWWQRNPSSVCVCSHLNVLANGIDSIEKTQPHHQPQSLNSETQEEEEEKMSLFNKWPTISGNFLLGDAEEVLVYRLDILA